MTGLRDAPFPAEARGFNEGVIHQVIDITD
jgi:hypothetical protein